MHRGRDTEVETVADTGPFGAPTVADTAARLGGGMDVAAVLREIATAAKEALGAARATCYAYDIPSQTVAALHTTETDPDRRRRLAGIVGLDPLQWPLWRVQMSIGDDPLMVIEDIAADDRLPEGLSGYLGAGAVMGVRLEHDSLRTRSALPLLGALYCSFDSPRSFTTHDHSTARGLASMASLALANAYLQMETARSLARARELELEQAALRRVATRVASSDATAPAVHSATAAEVARLLGVEAALVVRFDAEGACVVGAHGGPGVGDIFPTDGLGLLAQVARTGRGQVVGDYSGLPDDVIRARARALGYTAAAGAPVHVDGALWGAVVAATRRADGIPPGTEDRLERFAQLSAMAIANVEARATLVRQATHDPLTGLLNHGRFFERMDEVLAAARGNDAELGLVIVDLDMFKRVNDRFGHLAGDRALVEFADRLRGQARAGDVLGRTGGEEFAWLLPGSDLGATSAAAERLRRAIRGEPFPDVGHVTMSAGIATLVADESPADLFRVADAALYRAKEMGRDVCCGPQESEALG